jgi:hypothetical protein
VSTSILAWQVGKLGRDVDLGCLDRNKWAYERILNDGKCCIAGSVGKVAKLSAFGKNLLAGPEVDGEGDGDDNPDRAIEGRHAKKIPFT